MNWRRSGPAALCRRVPFIRTSKFKTKIWRQSFAVSIAWGGAELGCRIDKAYAGNGYGTEAFAAVAEWGLYKIHLSRVVAKCYKENQASYKMLSACMRKKGEDDTFFYFEKLV